MQRYRTLVAWGICSEYRMFHTRGIPARCLAYDLFFVYVVFVVDVVNIVCVMCVTCLHMVAYARCLG